VTLGGSGGRAPTRVACLDQADAPDEAVFWMEFRGREVMCAGWGTSGQVSWRAGMPWGLSVLPAASEDAPLGLGH
jgi:lariat debranching enzyme